MPMAVRTHRQCGSYSGFRHQSPLSTTAITVFVTLPPGRWDSSKPECESAFRSECVPSLTPARRTHAPPVCRDRWDRAHCAEEKYRSEVFIHPSLVRDWMEKNGKNSVRVREVGRRAGEKAGGGMVIPLPRKMMLAKSNVDGR